MKKMNSPLGSGVTARLGHPCPGGLPRWCCRHSRISWNGLGAMAAMCSQVCPILFTSASPPPHLAGFLLLAQKGTQQDGRGRQREQAESHILRACLTSDPGPASSSCGRSVEGDKRIRSNSSAEAQKKHPQVKPKSCPF